MTHISIVRRANIKIPFVPVMNHVARDARLSLDALGFLVHVLSNSGNFTIRKAVLMKQRGFGEDKWRRIIGELVAAGYARLTRLRDPSTGRVIGNGYQFYDTPDDAALATIEPIEDEPDTMEDQEDDSPSAYEVVGETADSALASHALNAHLNGSDVSPRRGFPQPRVTPAPGNPDPYIRKQTLQENYPLNPKTAGSMDGPSTGATTPDGPQAPSIQHGPAPMDATAVKRSFEGIESSPKASPTVIHEQWIAFKAAWRWDGEDAERARKRFVALGDEDRAKAIEVAPRVKPWCLANRQKPPFALGFLRSGLFKPNDAGERYLLPKPQVFCREGSEWFDAWTEYWRGVPGASPGLTGPKSIGPDGAIRWGKPLALWITGEDGKRAYGRLADGPWPPGHHGSPRKSDDRAA